MPTMIKLRHLDNRVFAQNFIGEYGVSPFGTWNWTVDCCCHEFECQPDDVDCTEDANGDEVITVRGEPVALQFRLYPPFC